MLRSTFPRKPFPIDLTASAMFLLVASRATQSSFLYKVSALLRNAEQEQSVQKKTWKLGHLSHSDRYETIIFSSLLATTFP